ncbi:MAG: DUF190 domain-containing protein, partial [Chloroflexi bacterium]|nr:DUF190 domain-containing protein [Chloroflexota bacterium]
MHMAGVGKRVQIFIDEGDSHRGRSLYVGIMERLLSEGAVGASVFRGIAGFGTHSRIHRASFADIASPLPLTIVWIDTPERVERLLPTICDMVVEGLVTVEDITIAGYAHRDLSQVHPSLRVGDLMTRDPAVVHRETPLSEIAHLLLERDLRSLPVVEQDGRLAGIITNGDLVERGGLAARLELLGASAPSVRSEAVASAQPATAGELMTPSPVSIAPHQPIQRAIELMTSGPFKRLPVTDVSGRLVGIISRVDILRGLGTSYPAPAEAEPGSAGHALVGDVMSRHAPVVREDARLAEVLDAVVSTRLNRAVVVDAQGMVRGVISGEAVLRQIDPHMRSGLLGALMRRDRAVPERAATTTAAELMTAPAMTVSAETPVDQAAR